MMDRTSIGFPEMKSLNILVVGAKYNLAKDGSYLTNDLVHALARLGHRMQVVSVEWDMQKGPHQTYNEGDGIRVMRFPARTLPLGRVAGLLYKWVFSSVSAMPSIRAALGRDHFDVVLAFAPAVTIYAPLKWALRRFGARSYIYNPDFFPYYHHSNGMIPGGLIFSVARHFENSVLRLFDVIGVMSPANASFLKRNFRLKESQRIAVMPLWGETGKLAPIDRAAVRREWWLPEGSFIALFGGQLIPGRGIEDVLEAARIARATQPEMLFLFLGKGSLRSLIDRYIADGGDNVRVMDPVDRDTYLQIAAACDVGINATAPHVVVPTFPTKTIDYVRAGLPIMAAVEHASDYGQFLEENELGLAVPAGEPAALFDGIKRLMEDAELRAKIRRAGPNALARHFDVDQAARAILDQLGFGEPPVSP